MATLQPGGDPFAKAAPRPGSPPPPVPIVRAAAGGGDDFGYFADQIAKAAVSQAMRPAGVHHRVGESVRLFTNLNGIREDLTPHHDANTKRALASRNPALRAVINTILSDCVSHFAKPLNEKAVGAKIVQRDRKKSVTQASAKRAQYLEDILFQGGIVRPHPETGEPGTWDAYGEVTGDTLQTAVRKLLLDSLVLDFGFVVKEGSIGRFHGGGHPVMHWKVEDGALMRFVDRTRYQPQIRTGFNGTDDIRRRCKYVQLSTDSTWRVDREYTWMDGRHFIRNPRTDTLALGYGESEIEQCMMALVGVLFCLQANQDYFSRNHIPMGVLNLIGNYDRADLQTLRMQLHQEVGYGSGGGLYDFPIISTPREQGAGAQWLAMQDKSKFDAVGRVYIELCVALISAIFQVAPEEYGFASFGGKTQVLSEADPESAIQHSKHRSVLPRVLAMCEFFNECIVHPIDPDFELVINGLDSLYTGEAIARADLETKQQQQGYTLNMLRARNDEPPVVDPKDWVLWRQVEGELAGKWFANDTVRMYAVIEEYEKRGGERCLWPDMPINATMAEVWKQEHGLQEQQQTQDQMNQMASAEGENQRAEAGAEAQAARDQMGALTQAAEERDAEEGSREREAAAKDELRVPQLADAGFGKALPPAGGGRIVVRIGPGR